MVYRDLGITDGMGKGIEVALGEGRRVVYRRLGEGWEDRYLETARKHSHAGVWGLMPVD